MSWIYLIQPYVRAADMTLLAKLTSIAYPLGDIVILCVLVRLVFGGGTRNMSVRLLTAGALGLLVADCVYGWIQLHGSWKVGGPTDMGWVVFYVLLGGGGAAPGHARADGGAALAAPAPEAGHSRSSGRDVARRPASPRVARRGRRTQRRRGPRRRLGGCVRSGHAPTDRPGARCRRSTLAESRRCEAFSERLVTATERSDVWNAAVDAVVAIGAAGVIGCVVTNQATLGEEIVAATWPELVGAAVEVAALDGEGDRRTIWLGGDGTVGAGAAVHELDPARAPWARRRS